MKTALHLSKGTVHLWMVDLSENTSEGLLCRYFEYLSPDERIRYNRFLLKDDRIRYLVTRTLVRIVLSRYACVAPHSWNFLADTFGRPYIANCDERTSNLCFNVSHTESLILLGIASGTAVGVDVENRRRRRAPIEAAERYFTANEVRDLLALPFEHRQDRFFDYWTLKEAYLKARGLGLSIPLDTFGFFFPTADTILFDVDGRLGEQPKHWRFWQFNPSPDYVAAVCTTMDLLTPTMLVKWIVPLRSEGLFEEIARQPGCRTS
jgi:4'-phosphopantetheinyl transferase